MEKQLIEERKEKILELIKSFCAIKLNDEYFELSRKLIDKLGRKRDVPFLSGQPEIWAVAIIHTLGTINFLFDKASEPYATVDEINNYFKTKKSTTGTKSKQIRDMLKLSHFDNEFSTSRINESNPFNNFVKVNGFIVSVDSLPLEYQEIVRSARAEGKDISFTTS